MKRSKSNNAHLPLPQAIAMAIKLHKEGQWQGAEALYQRILKLAPNQVDVLHFLGVVSHQLGKGERAVEYIRRAIKLQPDYVDAYNNLGNVLKELGRMDEAVAMYHEVISRRSEHAEAHNNLGVALKELGEYAQAAVAYRQALVIKPEYADAWHNLGNVLKKLGELEQSLSAYRQALTLKPYHVEAYKNLGRALYVAGRAAEAVEVYQQWLTLEPGNPIAEHMLAACVGGAGPERASDDFVRQTFDNFACNFDVVLERLEYRAPTLVAQAVSAQLGLPDGTLTVLDAGCGTGLCGADLRPYAQALVGVDLSGGMLAKASGREIYDELREAELTAFLGGQYAAYDLIVSADTLCYFGALGPLLGAAAGSLRPSGRLIFTVELAGEAEAPEGFCIQPHGRYAHSADYVTACLTQSGLNSVALEQVVLRKEAGQPVVGLVVVANHTPQPAPTRGEAML